MCNQQFYLVLWIYEKNKRMAPSLVIMIMNNRLLFWGMLDLGVGLDIMDTTGFVFSFNWLYVPAFSDQSMLIRQVHSMLQLHKTYHMLLMRMFYNPDWLHMGYSLNSVHTKISWRPLFDSQNLHCVWLNQWSWFKYLSPLNSIDSSRWIYAIISEYI